MREREQRLWDSMREQAALASRFPDPSILLERVENMASDGMPDVRAHVQRGAESWIELKAIASWPARSNTPALGRDGLRTSQENWIHRHTVQYGGRALILIGVGRGAERLLYGIEGTHAMMINRYTRSMIVEAAAVTTWAGLMSWIRNPRRKA